MPTLLAHVLLSRYRKIKGTDYQHDETNGIKRELAQPFHYTNIWFE